MLLSVDPGEATGYGWVTIEDTQLVHWSFNEAPFHKFNELADTFLRCTYSEEQRIDVYCERFVIGSNTHTKVKGDCYWSIETIGLLRHVCRVTGHHFELQSQSDAKANWSDKRLQRAGWWIEGDKAAGIKGTHARDAAKHMLLALSRHHAQVYFDLVK